MRTNLKKRLTSPLLTFLILIFPSFLMAEIQVIKEVPSGFKTPSQEIIYVDVYYRQQFLISARVEVKNDKFKFLYPTKVYEKIPLVKIDKAKAVMKEFQTEHIFNTEYACFPDRKVKCDMLNTELIDFIFNPDTFTVEIVTNNNIFLKKEQDNLFLPPPPTEFSQFFTFNGVGYWSKDKSGISNDYFASPLFYNSKNQDQYNFVANSKTSFNRFILNADVNWTNQQNNLYFDNINVTRYYRGYNLQIGEFNTEELRSLNQGNLLGVSFRSSIDRRRDDTGTFSQPLNVFLNYRSRVNIIKDGRIYSTQYYDSGNQTLDTSGLPFGSYNVELEIIEPNGKTRKETQFFVKNGELPPSKEPYYWFQFGAIESEDGQVSSDNLSTQYFNKYENQYLFRTGIYKRAFRAFGLGTNLMINENISAAEAFLEYYGRFLSLRTSFGYDTENDYSYNVYAELLNIKKFVVFFTWTQNYLNKDSLDKDLLYRPISSYSKQGSGNIRYYFGQTSNSLNFVGNYSKDYLNNELYSLGPVLEFNFNFGANTMIRTTLNAYKTEKDYQASLNFFFNFNSKYVQIYNNSTYRMNKERSNPKDFSDHFDSSTALTLQDGGVFNQDLRFTMRYDEADRVETKAVELDYRSAIGRFTADASTNQHINEYSVNFASIFAFNKEHMLFGGREPKQAAIAFEIDGGNDSSSFDIYVDQNKLDFVKGDSTRVLPLNPFNQYQILLQAKGVNNTIVEDNRLKLVTLYPGSIRTLKYKAKSTVIIIGTLYSQNGKVLKNTLVHGEVDEVITDENGYFQITAVLDETLNVGDNMKFKVDKNIIDTKNNVIFLKKVVVDKI